MSKTAACPSCGAPVAFRASASVYAVCDFCHSTLVRQDQDLKNLGRMADLLEDGSILQRGTEGAYRGTHFAVVGRIQLKYGAGFWNEWHLLFDDGRSGWLSEAGGEYVVSFLARASEPLPAFGSMRAGKSLMLSDRSFTVTDLETAHCIAGEGELPFKIDAGYEVDTADLRSEDGKFATIDYSEDPPLLFIGEPVPAEGLNFANLRDAKSPQAGGAPQLKAGQVKAFACPKCASPLAIHSEKIETIACGSCGSLLDATDPNYRILAEADRAERIDPAIPLGSRGRLRKTEWEIIGFMRRQSKFEGMVYPWSEYLLFEPKAGFAWLTESDGHWNFVRTLSQHPSSAAGVNATDARLGSEIFRNYSGYSAETVYVVGEFYWRVAAGEQVQVRDFVAPPKMLSEERTENEIVWSLADYLEPDEVWQAFKLKTPPRPRAGIAPNQPNPHVETSRSNLGLFWKLSLAALLIQLGFVLTSGGLVHRQTLAFRPGDNEAVNTAQFVLTKAARSLEVRHRTDLSNGWITLNTALINKDSGASREISQDLAYYEGYEDGESWSEGRRNDKRAFADVPAGTYYLVIDAEAAPSLRNAVGDSLEVLRDPAGWTNWIFLQCILVVFPALSLWRRSSFETRRWANSDFAQDDEDSAEDED
ncbi:MAG: DUF4178 domain-containing protein [Betaproteobacteria bacterium]|nr:DUF4178 domain-containing protein [Betaproteobacteria bacterium]